MTSPETMGDTVVLMDDPEMPASDGGHIEPEHGVRICRAPGCTNIVPPEAHRLRRYCDEHFVRTEKRKLRKKPRDRAPRNIMVDLAPKGRNSKNDELVKVEDRVKQLLGIVSGAVAMAGSLEDAADIARHRDTVAAALKELARYEPWLRKLATGGEVGDRMMAWVAAILAILAMVIPIADRHGLIPGELRPMLAGLSGPPVAPSGDGQFIAA